MRKKSKYILSLIVGLMSLTLLSMFAFLPRTSPPSEPISAPPTVTASATTKSNIFTEITNDGLASYLEIKLTSSYITDIKITQTIGNISYIPTKDELGTTCYYKDTSNLGNNLVFYFSRPAIYTVQYIVNNDTIVTESYSFTPKLNTEVINSLYTTTDSGQSVKRITSTPNAYYFLHAGETSIVTDSKGLYTISAYINSNGHTPILSPSLVTTIPENVYDLITYKITSVNGNNTLNLEIYALTAKLNIEFTNDTTSLVKDDFFHLNGYVFNSGVNYELTVDATTENLSNTTLTSEEKIELLSHLNFSLKSEERNLTNTATLSSVITPIEKEVNAISIKGHLKECDHSIFTLVCEIDGATVNNVLNTNIPQIKIITKVPQNTSGNYAFSLVLEQVPNSITNNYIAGVLDGYIKTGTIVYFPTGAVRLFYNGYADGYSNSASALNFKNGANTGTIGQNPDSEDFSNNDSIVEIENNTTNFNDYFYFNFQISTYSNGTDFIKGLSGHMFYNGTNEITDDFANVDNKLTNPINSFSYIVPTNYETDCIPLHMRVTYNGTSFDDIYKMEGGDEIKLTNYGAYTVEFYNLPSYHFLLTNLSTDNISKTRYYYKLEFVISGPSIYASTTDNNGQELTLSNNLYTQNPATVKVDMPTGYQFIAYKNGNEFARRDASLIFSLSDTGTWKIVIVDGAGNEAKSLTFTIADTIYQGFSINNQNEYLSLIVSTRTSAMPELYEEMAPANAYHLTSSGTYKVEIDAREYFDFSVKKQGASAYTSENTYTINSNTLKFEVAKSHFSMHFTSGSNGSRTSEKIILASVSGVQLQSLEVFRNGKSVKTFTAEELADFATLIETSRTFGDNGTYTFKLTDKFGNTYEAQIEKYYKVNVALIVLILLAIVGIVVMIVVIIKSRHKIKVK